MPKQRFAEFCGTLETDLRFLPVGCSMNVWPSGVCTYTGVLVDGNVWPAGACTCIGLPVDGNLTDSCVPATLVGLATIMGGGVAGKVMTLVGLVGSRVLLQLQLGPVLALWRRKGRPTNFPGWSTTGTRRRRGEPKTKEIAVSVSEAVIEGADDTTSSCVCFPNTDTPTTKLGMEG